VASLDVHFSMGTVFVALPPREQLDSDRNRLKQLDLLGGVGLGSWALGLRRHLRSGLSRLPYRHF
jgi:hypothetical protein